MRLMEVCLSARQLGCECELERLHALSQRRLAPQRLDERLERGAVLAQDERRLHYSTARLVADARHTPRRRRGEQQPHDGGLVRRAALGLLVLHGLGCDPDARRRGTTDE